MVKIHETDSCDSDVSLSEFMSPIVALAPPTPPLSTCSPKGKRGRPKGSGKKKPPKKHGKRGRPKGSGKKKPPKIPGKRGRPKGSKNKKKTANATHWSVMPYAASSCGSSSPSSSRASSRSPSPCGSRARSQSVSSAASDRSATGPVGSRFLKWGKDHSELVYDYKPHRITFKNEDGNFKQKRLPNKSCRYLLSHCSRTHPTKRDTKPRKTLITIKKRPTVRGWLPYS